MGRPFALRRSPPGPAASPPRTAPGRAPPPSSSGTPAGARTAARFPGAASAGLAGGHAVPTIHPEQVEGGTDQPAGSTKQPHELGAALWINCEYLSVEDGSPAPRSTSQSGPASAPNRLNVCPRLERMVQPSGVRKTSPRKPSCLGSNSQSGSFQAVDRSTGDRLNEGKFKLPLGGTRGQHRRLQGT
jgi:hypothetical protein